MKDLSDQKNILNNGKWRQVLGPQIPIVHTGMGSTMDTHYDPTYEHGQQSSGYGGPSHGYGQYGFIKVPPQQPPPNAYPFPVGEFGGQVHLMPMGQFGYGHSDPSNYGKGP